MTAARASAFRGKGIGVAAAVTLFLLPLAGEACPRDAEQCASEHAADSASNRVNAAKVDPSPAQRAMIGACATIVRAAVCPIPSTTAEPVAQPAPVDPIPVEEPDPQTRPSPRKVVAAVARTPSVRARSADRVAPTRPRVLVVPRFVEVVVERPALAVSAAVGLVSALGLFMAFVVGGRRRRRAALAAAELSARTTYDQLTESVVGNLSHELFTPLTPVKGYASMLKRADLPPQEVHAVADKLMAASGRLERVVETLVALAEMERTEPNARRDVVDANALMLRILERAPEQRRRSISLSVDASVRDFRANERLLELAVWALLDNAIKFSAEGDPVRVEVRARGTERERVEFRITDRGIGMTHEQMRVAFEAFRQVDGSTTRAYEGLGIGLALAERVARAHGGRVLAVSRTGKGSTFTLSFPLIPGARAIAVALPPRDRRAGDRRARYTA
jgi:signal transduction histidine kinase